MSMWKGRGGPNERTIYGVGLAPVFRYVKKSGDYLPYLEGAVGAHFYSGVRLHDNRRMATRFEFGDHVGQV